MVAYTSQVVKLTYKLAYKVILTVAQSSENCRRYEEPYFKDLHLSILDRHFQKLHEQEVGILIMPE